MFGRLLICCAELEKERYSDQRDRFVIC